MRILLLALCACCLVTAPATAQRRKKHPVIEEFLQHFSNPDPFVRRDLAERLSKVQTEEAVQLLVRHAFKDDVPDVRYGASNAISRMRSEEAREAIVEALDDPDPQVRGGLLEGLGGMEWKGSDPPFAAIEERLLDDSSAYVRTMAAEALGRIGRKEAVPALCKALSDRHEDVIIAASDAVALIKDPKAAKALLGVLRHRSWRVQVAVLHAFTQIRVKDAVAPIIDYMRDAAGRPRHDARRALVAITQRTFGTDADTWEEWWGRMKEDFAVPDPKAQRAEVEEATQTGYESSHKRGYHRMKITSNRLLFVLDISSSMLHPILLARGVNDENVNVAVKKLKIAREELAFTLRGLDSDTWFNVVAFETNIRVWRKDAVRATPGTVAAAVRWVERQKPRQPGGRMKQSGGRDSKGRIVGRTNTWGALRVIFGMPPEGRGGFTPGGRRRSKPSWDTCYFLTDGEPTVGTYTKTEDILPEVRRWHATNRIEINCIGMNATSAMRDLLDGLARITGGQVVYLGR